MKKHLLTLLLLCGIGIGGAHAATVSGTVTSTATCAAVAGQKVYLSDTATSTLYVDSAVTNASGFYTISFPSSWTSSRIFQVTAPACGTLWTLAANYFVATNATLNIVVCGPTTRFIGTVLVGGSQNTGPARVWLIKVRRNYPIAGDTTLTAVDSITLTNGGSFAFRSACPLADTFVYKAALLPGHPSYSNYLPTYSDTMLTWSTAKRYYSSSYITGPTGPSYYVYLLPGTNPGGPGFIGGSVLVGANKSTAVGDPLASRILILANAATNAPVAYTYSDAAGKFSFSNIAVGSYKLFGDAWGLYNVPLNVSITNTQKTVSNIIFEENYGENTFKGRLSSTAVSTVSGPLADVAVFPNPATTTLSLKGVAQIRGSKTLILRNLIGATVAEKTFADGQAPELAVAGLPAGAYVLQVATEIGTVSFKVTK